jgi:predicted RNA-binding protein with PUA-like domain
MALVRIGRLSVQPVTEQEYDVILELAGEKK